MFLFHLTAQKTSHITIHFNTSLKGKATTSERVLRPLFQDIPARAPAPVHREQQLCISEKLSAAGA